MKASYGKFCDMIKNVNINVPLVDLISGMPNYSKFIKELVSNKGKIEEIASLNTECSSVVQNGKIPPKLTDPGSFLLTCTFSQTYHCNALADLGASINLMPYSLYAKLALGVLKPTKMSVRLADQTFQYPLGIVENMLVQVGRFVFPVDFVILEMEEDSKVPLILGRPFLNTADAIIRVKKKEISLGVGDDRETFSYYKSKKHSYSTDETCFKIDVIDNDMCDLELQDFLDDEELDEEQEEKSLDLELEELLGKDMVSVDSTINGDITLEEFERMFDLSTEPVVTKKENEDGGEECLETEMKVDKAIMKALDSEPCAKLKVDKGSISKSKGLDEFVESDDLFNELDELIMNADLEEFEEGKEREFDEELRELLGEESGLGNGSFEIDIDNINSENLEEFLNFVDDPDPKVAEFEKDDDLEVKKNPPELSEPQLQGMHDFMDKLISYLSCRKDEGLGKVGVESFHDRERKCKNFCIHFGDLRRGMIFGNTKQWNDAMVNSFEKVLVSNETCVFEDGSLCDYCDTRK